MTSLAEDVDDRWQVAVFALLAAAAAFLLARNLAPALRFEDAMIVLRYARNIAAGQGFVFNPGERVLGVTTPLHTLIAVLWVALGGSEGAPVWQNLFGLACLIGEATLVLLLGRRLGAPAAGLLAALATLGNFRLSYLYLGMETHLFGLLVLAAFGVALRDDLEELRPQLWLGALLGLAFLVRYDAALPALLIGLELWRRFRRPPWRLGAGFGAAVLPWLLFASVYFGSFLPKSLAAKESFVGAGTYLSAAYESWRLTFVQLFALYSPVDRANAAFSWLFPAILAGGAALVVWRRPLAWPLALYPFLHLAAYAAIGADPAFQWHLWPLAPCFFLFTACAATGLAGWAWRGRSRWWPALATLAALAPLALDLHRNASWKFTLDPHSRQLYAMAHYLRDHYPPETSLLQPSIGILGYESGLRMIDHAGLVTPGLYYFHDGDCTPLPEVIARHRPDLILLGPWSPWTPEQLQDLGYRLAHGFELDFVYRLYERAA